MHTLLNEDVDNRVRGFALREITVGRIIHMQPYHRGLRVPVWQS